MLALRLVHGLLAVLLAVAALWDIRKRRIPNFLSAATLAIGLIEGLVGGAWAGVLSGLGASLLTIAVGWIPWTRGWIGGGDVKLAAAAASAVGLSLLHEYLLVTALVGAVVAMVCYLLSSQSTKQEIVTNLKIATVGVLPDAPIRGGNGRISVPYGVACAIAALVIVFARKG